MTTQMPVLIPELVDAAYNGTVVKTGDGFCFINDVVQGYATVPTNGDVFCPAPFAVGSRVEFNMLNEDPERSNERAGRKFRIESAVVIATPEGLVVGDTVRQIAKAGAILELTRKRAAYHIRAKQIMPEAAQKAAANGPFDTMADIVLNPEASAADMGHAAEEFLRKQFPTLADMGFSCSMEEGEEERKNEASLIAETEKVYKDIGLGGQIVALHEDYRQFNGVRGIFRMLKKNDLLRPESVIPIHHMPDLLMAAPVWYMRRSPNVEAHVPFFSQRVGSQEFANLFQLYNYNRREINEFSGRNVGGVYTSDTMPPKIARMMGEAWRMFDYVVICTPYHDIASNDWADQNWRRNVDPFLFGFQRGLDFMFLFGRWSGTGLFPLLAEMIADTVNHLSVNRERIARVGGQVNWYNVKRGWWTPLDSTARNENEGNKVLVPFVDALVAAFEAGQLFPFLRGELKDEATGGAKA